ncbi:MAG TPA: YfiR family protein [Candidatus Acidoferrum sp.]
MRQPSVLMHAPLLASLSLLVCLSSPYARAQAIPPDELARASYLDRVVGFVDWPANTPQSDKTFRLCVFGNRWLSYALAEQMRGEIIGGRRVEVLNMQKEAEASHCQVIIFGDSSNAIVSRVLESVRGHAVLTVGEARGFVDTGGVIELSEANNTFQFRVNLAAARNAGLRIDARLLEMAKRVVRGKNGAGG